jgi:hypothetical protein
MGQLFCRTPQPRGLRRPFDRHLPVAPFCEVDDQGSRPDRWPLPSLDSAPRGASRPFLECRAKMPRTRFYNRRSRHEHPRMNTTFGDSRRALWETRQRSTSRPTPGETRHLPVLPGTAPDHLAVIRPPTAACLTARRRLRADWLPPGRSRASGWGRAPQLSRLPVTPPNQTL